MEEWKDVVGYEGIYQVSSCGGVRFSDGRPKAIRKDKDGYAITTLIKDKVQKTMKVHRLVATAFIDNPLSLPMVNHKDEVKDNNNVDNLEWCTSKHNANYGTRNEKISNKQKGRPNPHCKGEKNYFYGKHFARGLHPMAKKVAQLDANGKIMTVFDCTGDAADSVNCSPSAIGLCCRGERHTTKGYKWIYV